MDAGGAVTLLKNAGEDIDRLSEAIRKASFLDDTPGEDRQKLRGACGAAMAWSYPLLDSLLQPARSRCLQLLGPSCGSCWRTGRREAPVLAAVLQ